MEECDKSSVVNIQNIDNKIKQINTLLKEILEITKSNCINKNYDMSPQNINSDPTITDTILPKNINPDLYKKTTDKQTTDKTTDKQTADNYRGSIQITVKRNDDGILRVRCYVEGEQNPSLLLSIDISTKIIDVITIPKDEESMCILYNVIDYLLSNYFKGFIINVVKDNEWFIKIDNDDLHSKYKGLFESVTESNPMRQINLKKFYTIFEPLCVSKHYNVSDIYISWDNYYKGKTYVIETSFIGGGFHEQRPRISIKLKVDVQQTRIDILRINPTSNYICMLYNTIKALRGSILPISNFNNWTIHIFHTTATEKMFLYNVNEFTRDVFTEFEDGTLMVDLQTFYNHYQKLCEIKRLDENMGGSIKKKRRYKKSSSRKSSNRKSSKRKSLKKKKSTKRKKRKRKTKRMR